ncbi:MaoC family dehydratase N-terminal domain-containing protein [Mesorhizobium sp. IMUNJ 23232]|uniref:FAS1-like dehydratase domain-containing protein n=1 Tax=Mesorhizobium sp. IMUNJ 23232 TaxID=3376064 RepID=UPI0037B996AC
MIRVGDILDEWEFQVEAGKVREFARAVQDEHANGSPIAPPTFPVVISADFVERLVTSLLVLDRSRTVHGEQTYEYFRPIVAGDLLRCRARLVGDETKTGKRGGTMRIITTEVEFVSATDGTLVCRETMASIEKGAAGS